MRIKERRRAESQGMQEGELIGARPIQRMPLPADDRDHDVGHVFRQRGIFSNVSTPPFLSFFFAIA